MITIQDYAAWMFMFMLTLGVLYGFIALAALGIAQAIEWYKNLKKESRS